MENLQVSSSVSLCMILPFNGQTGNMHTLSALVLVCFKRKMMWCFFSEELLFPGALALPLIAICIKKPFIIIITSFYGGKWFHLFFFFLFCLLSFVETFWKGCCVAFGVAAFIPSGYSYFPLWVDPNFQSCNPVWQVYVFFAGIVVLTILGIVLQACMFAREITWDK